jgi:hypothetical protein
MLNEKIVEIEEFLQRANNLSYYVNDWDFFEIMSLSEYIKQMFVDDMLNELNSHFAYDAYIWETCDYFKNFMKTLKKYEYNECNTFICKINCDDDKYMFLNLSNNIAFVLQTNIFVNVEICNVSRETSFIDDYINDFFENAINKNDSMSDKINELKNRLFKIINENKEV